MSEQVKTYPVKENIAQSAHFTSQSYQTLYQQSINDPETFWSEQAESFLDWSQPWNKTVEFDYQCQLPGSASFLPW